MNTTPDMAPRAPAPGRRRLALHIIVPALVALGVGGLLLESGAEALRPATPVTVRPVVFDRSQPEPEAAPLPQSGAQPARPGGQAVQAAGWLEPDPFVIAATALADGIVAEALALEGDYVEEGQTLATLVDADARLALARAEADLGAREAEVAVAQAGLAAAEGDWEHPVERERAVASARASVALAEAELAQLPSMIAAEEALLARDEEELKRAREALAQRAASDLEVIRLEQAVAAQAATVESMRLREAILLAQRDGFAAELAAAERNAELRIDERRALDGARAAVTAAEAAAAQARAARDEAQLRLERMVIRAPISGFVQRRLKAPGDKVMLGMDDPHSSHIAHLYDPEKLQARVDVPLADAAQIFAGQECEVVVEALPDVTFAGEVTRITHEADVQKNTLQVKVRVIDPSPVLRPEMLTRVKFLPAGRASGSAAAPAEDQPVLVPEAAIEGSGGSARVWVVRDRRSGAGVVRAAPVSIISTSDGWAKVRGVLRPGDLLAMEPAGLEDGERVRMRDAAEEDRS